MTVLFWHYQYDDMKTGWRDQTVWLANAFKSLGYRVLRHANFKCQGFEWEIYDPAKHRNEVDYTIYNHADKSEIIGNVVPSIPLFMKPTVPTPKHTTLDTLGFGPYSSITYVKPDFESVSVGDYFETKVASWINSRTTKWEKHKQYDCEIFQDNYFLVLGQCGGDSVVTRHDFGGYWNKLMIVVKELRRVGGGRPIVVKLHPYMDGNYVSGASRNRPSDRPSEVVIKRLLEIGSGVFVYAGKGNIHEFIKRAHCVFLANSGAGFEVMMHHKPIIAWGYPEYHWVTYDLRHAVDVYRAIELDWFDREKQDKFLCWYTEHYCYNNQDTATRRVKEVVGGDCN